MRESSGKEAYKVLSYDKGAESVKVELRNQKVYFNVLKHDRLFSRSSCFVNFGLTETVSYYNGGQKTNLELK